MKKKVAMILCIVFVLSLISCKTKTEQTDKPSVDLQSETENNNGDPSGSLFIFCDFHHFITELSLFFDTLLPQPCVGNLKEWFL